MQGLYPGGRPEYPWAFVLGQNAVYLGQFLLGALLIEPLSPAASLVYLGFLVLMLGVVLRKHLCSHCYYYGRRCGTGWGLLAARLFPRGNGNYALGVRLAGITWGVAYLLPLLAAGGLWLVPGGRVSLPVLFGFLLFSLLGFFWHRASCASCKMRCRCPASMVRCSLPDRFGRPPF